MNRMDLVSWVWRPVGGIREVGAGDLALAGGLSLYMATLVAGQPHGSTIAAVVALAMTIPVAWQRRAPLAAAAAVAAGAGINELLIGRLIRCGPGLPAVFAIAFFVGTRCAARRLAAGAALCLSAVTIQAIFDPRLGPSSVVVMLPVTAGFCAAGQLARSRSLALATLRARNAELRAQRDQTARLAVVADRSRVAGELDAFLRDRITAMAQAVSAGRLLVDSDPAAARDVLAAVETSGRATLSQMREVVGTLREESLVEPQPVLAQLGSLLERATSADARLHVEGSPRTLPAGLELSGYRIVEHLLVTLEDAADARIDVRVRFGPDALELQVTGPAATQADAAPAIAVARERAAVLGGTLSFDTSAGRCAAFVRVPLPTGYA